MGTPEKVATHVRVTQNEPAILQKEILLTAGHGVTMSPWLILLEWLCPKHFGVDASRREEKGMGEPVTDCTWNMKIMNS